MPAAEALVNQSTADMILPFSVAVAEATELRRPITHERKVIIDFAGPEGTFRRISAQDVLAGDLRKELEGKIVILGGLHQMAETLTPEGSMSLDEVHANGIQTLMRPDAGAWAPIANVVLLACAGLMFYFWRARFLWLGISLLAAFFVSPLIASTYAWRLPVIGLLVLLAANWGLLRPRLR